jgi:hypothetical protein
VRELSCTEEESATEFNERVFSADVEFTSVPVDESAEQIAPDDYELDRYDTGVYLCRWPNGEFSVVTPDSKRDAIIALDEWAALIPARCTRSIASWQISSSVKKVRLIDPAQ